MGRRIIILLFIILFCSSVFAVNYDYIYNPYTAKQDRSIKLNQTGNNISADYYSGSGILLSGINISGNYTGTNMYPSETLTYDIGSGALRWNNTYTANLNTETIDASGNITANNFIGELNGENVSDTYVPYTGAHKLVNLNVNNLYGIATSWADDIWVGGQDVYGAGGDGSIIIYSDNTTNYMTIGSGNTGVGGDWWATDQMMWRNADDLFTFAAASYATGFYIDTGETYPQLYGVNGIMEITDVLGHEPRLIIDSSLTNPTFNSSTGVIDFLGNVSVDEYIFGQPLGGSIGSGIIKSASNKIYCGCINVTDEGGLNVSYHNTTFRINGLDGTTTYCDITEDTVTVLDDAHTVYYVDDTCTLQTSSWTNYFDKDINPSDYKRFFDVYTSDGDIEVLKGASLTNLNNRKTRWLSISCGGRHLSICDGIGIIEDTFPAINQSSGHYRYLNSEVTSAARSSSTKGIHIVSHNNSVWTHFNQSGMNFTHCDNGTDLIPCSTDKYRRYIVYTLGWGSSTKIHQLAPLDGEHYNFLSDCLNTEKNSLSYTLPSTEDGVAIPHHVYCGKRDGTSWIDGWIDIRLGKEGFGAVPDLSNFLSYDGLTKNWDAGSYNITAEEIKAKSDWINNQNYPAACPANTYVIQINDSTTCTAITQIDNDVLLDGDLNVTGTVYAHNFSGNSDILFINGSGDEIVRFEEDGDVNISGTLDVDGNATIVGTMNLGNGSIWFNDSSAIYMYYNGSEWAEIGSGNGDGVPNGMIAAFDLDTCPTGWTLADGTVGTPDLRGIFVRGSGTSGVLNDSNNNAFTATRDSYENDSFQGHRHFLTNAAGTTGVSNYASVYQNPDTSGSGYTGLPKADSTHGTPRTATETQPANYATIYCMKINTAGEEEGIWEESNGSTRLINRSNLLNVSNVDAQNFTITAFTMNNKTITSFDEINSIPEGAIMAFDLAECPLGWTLANGSDGTPDLRGIFVRGSGTSGELSDANGAGFTATRDAYENDAFQGHKHTFDPSDASEYKPSPSPYAASGAVFNYMNTASGTAAHAVWIGNPKTDGSHGTPRTATETQPANWATIYCVKTDTSDYSAKLLFERTGENITLVNDSNVFVPGSPVGVVNQFAGSTAPTGWLMCNGAAISRTAYSRLYGVIGITYGNNTGNDFKVPDTRGVFVRGAGTSGSLTDANSGAFAATLGTYQNDAFQGHNHMVRTTNNHIIATTISSGETAGVGFTNLGVGSNYEIAHAKTMETDGSHGTPRTATESRPANLALNHIIKY